MILLNKGTCKNAIELRNINFKYKKNNTYVLKNVTFAIEFGSFHVFIGENGAGKTTTMKIINNLLLDYCGDVLINCQNLKDKNFVNSNVSYFLDTTDFPKNLSIFDYLFNSALIFRKDVDNLKQQINDYLVAFDLLDFKNKNPKKLSLGQKKKVLLIRSLLDNSNIFILDEPVANLDPTARLQFFKELKRNQLKKGVTIFISTHVISEIQDYIDSATFIRKGQIVWSGKIHGKQLLKKYLELIVETSEEHQLLEKEKVYDN